MFALNGVMPAARLATKTLSSIIVVHHNRSYSSRSLRFTVRCFGSVLAYAIAAASSAPMANDLQGGDEPASAAWPCDTGIGRLVCLSRIPTPAEPPGVPRYREPTHDEWLQALRVRADYSIHKKVISLRRQRWDENSAMRIEPWMTLTPEKDLGNWKEVLHKEMGCDKEACKAFVHVVKEHGLRGMLECCRIIAHLIKDKDTTVVQAHGDWSHWLRRSCKDADDVLHDKQDLDDADSITSKKQKAN